MMMIENPATESLFQARNGVSTALVQGLAKNEEKKKKKIVIKLIISRCLKLPCRKRRKAYEEAERNSKRMN